MSLNSSTLQKTSSVAKQPRKANVIPISRCEVCLRYIIFFAFKVLMESFRFKGIFLDQRDILNISTHFGMENMRSSLKEVRTMIVNQR